MTDPKTDIPEEVPQAPTPESEDPAPLEVSEEEAQREAIEIAEQLEKMERKPPLYRFFRGSMYSLYLIVAAWLIAAIVVGSWQGIWGEAGKEIRRTQNEARPVTATGQPAGN